MKWGVICRVVYQTSSHTVNVHSHPPGRRMINVLISPAGTEIGREIWLSLRYEKTVKLFPAGSSYGNHARYNGERNPILPDVNEDGWLQALRACVLLYDIHFIFPAYSVTQHTSAGYQAEISKKIVSSDSKICQSARYKCHPYGVQDIISPSRRDNLAEEIESWSVFIKPNGKKCAHDALKINDKSTLEIQLCDKHDLSISALRRSSEYTVACFTHRKYDDFFCTRRRCKGIQAGLSSDLSFLYEQHNAHASVTHAATLHYQRRSERQHVGRQRMKSLFGRAIHFNRSEKTPWCIAHTTVSPPRRH